MSMRLFPRWKRQLVAVGRAAQRGDRDAVMKAAFELYFLEQEKKKYVDPSPEPITVMLVAVERNDIDAVMEHATNVAEILTELGEMSVN